MAVQPITYHQLRPVWPLTALKILRAKLVTPVQTRLALDRPRAKRRNQFDRDNHNKNQGKALDPTSKVTVGRRSALRTSNASKSTFRKNHKCLLMTQSWNLLISRAIDISNLDKVPAWNQINQREYLKNQERKYLIMENPHLRKNI